MVVREGVVTVHEDGICAWHRGSGGCEPWFWWLRTVVPVVANLGSGGFLIFRFLFGYLSTGLSTGIATLSTGIMVPVVVNRGSGGSPDLYRQV